MSFADAPIMSVCFLFNQGKFSVLPSTCPLFITVLGYLLNSCEQGQVGEFRMLVCLFSSWFQLWRYDARVEFIEKRAF